MGFRCLGKDSRGRYVIQEDDPNIIIIFQDEVANDFVQDMVPLRGKTVAWKLTVSYLREAFNGFLTNSPFEARQ